MGDSVDNKCYFLDQENVDPNPQSPSILVVETPDKQQRMLEDQPQQSIPETPEHLMGVSTDEGRDDSDGDTQIYSEPSPEPAKKCDQADGRPALSRQIGVTPDQPIIIQVPMAPRAAGRISRRRRRLTWDDTPLKMPRLDADADDVPEIESPDSPSPPPTPTQTASSTDGGYTPPVVEYMNQFVLSTMARQPPDSDCYEITKCFYADSDETRPHTTLEAAKNLEILTKSNTDQWLKSKNYFCGNHGNLDMLTACSSRVPEMIPVTLGGIRKSRDFPFVEQVKGRVGERLANIIITAALQLFTYGPGKIMSLLSHLFTSTPDLLIMCEDYCADKENQTSVNDNHTKGSVDCEDLTGSSVDDNDDDSSVIEIPTQAVVDDVRKTHFMDGEYVKGIVEIKTSKQATALPGQVLREYSLDDMFVHTKPNYITSSFGMAVRLGNVFPESLTKAIMDRVIESTEWTLITKTEDLPEFDPTRLTVTKYEKEESERYIKLFTSPLGKQVLSEAIVTQHFVKGDDIDVHVPLVNVTQEGEDVCDDSSYHFQYMLLCSFKIPKAPLLELSQEIVRRQAMVCYEHAVTTMLSADVLSLCGDQN